MINAEDLDWGTLAAIAQGYLVYAVEDQERQRAARPEFVITEDSRHNEFLNRRCFYPGLYRHVTRKMESTKFDTRIRSLVAAIVAKAVSKEGTLQDWALAEAGTRRDATIARQQARMVEKYLGGAVSTQPHAKTNDARQATFSTAFDRSPNAKWPDVEAPLPNIQDWLDAPKQRFKSLQDWAEVNGFIICTYPEALRVWNLVREQVELSLSKLLVGPNSESSISKTLRHPFAVNALANHISSLLVNDWWRSKGPQIQEDLLRTPRVFEYRDQDAVAAGTQWLRLAEKDPEWGGFGLFLLQQASVGLSRWDANGPAGVLLGVVSDMNGLTDFQRGHLLENAAIYFRRANRTTEFEDHMRRAVAAFDKSTDTKRRVLARVNLAESLGGPASNQEASQLLIAGLELAGTDPDILATFWRNVHAMHLRFGDEPREEAALDGVSPFFDHCLPGFVSGARDRIIELNQRFNQRPLEPRAALLPDSAKPAD